MTLSQYQPWLVLAIYNMSSSYFNLSIVLTFFVPIYDHICQTSTHTINKEHKQYYNVRSAIKPTPLQIFCIPKLTTDYSCIRVASLHVYYMKSYIISGIKIVIQLILFVAFLIHFGIPSLEIYGKEETISVTSEAETNGIDAPAVTISVFYGAQGTDGNQHRANSHGILSIWLSIVKTSRCQICNSA